MKKFLRSYVYKRRSWSVPGPKSPHRLYCCCCCCCCRCRCRQAVGAVNVTTASTTSKTICDMRYAICDMRYAICDMAVTAFKLLQLLFPLSLSLSLNVNIQKLKSVSLVPRGTSALHKNKIKNCSTWNKCHAVVMRLAWSTNLN